VRVVVVGASGNIGTSLLAALAGEATVESVLGISRRRPAAEFPKTDWAEADIRQDDLVPLFRGADAVVHLAWAIQPSRDEEALRRANVWGSRRVFRAVAESGVPALVYSSSVGTYSVGPKDRTVDETWRRDGIPTSFYARHKAEVERALDLFEREHRSVRVVRLRPALVFKRGAASGIRRLFAGPFLLTPLLRRRFVPFVPSHPRLRFQAVHSLDVGEAFRLALTRDVRGAFNVAADPVLDGETLGRLLEARPVAVPARALRGAAALTWRLHLQPTPPGWIDLAFGVPLLGTSRARAELGWTPARTASEAFLELMAGIREGAGLETPPLFAETGGPGRAGEVASGVGERET
jgi:nucleoside-diphosphate-sugar epimerase